MMKETYESLGNQNCLLYTLEPQDVLEVESLRAMVKAGGQLEGFVATTFYQDEGTKFISYAIGEMVTLEAFLSKPMPLGACLQALEGLRTGIATVFAHNLNPNTVPLDPYHVFADPATGETRLLCVPLERQLPPNCNLKNLCLYVARKAQAELEEDTVGFAVLRERLMGMEFVTPHTLGLLLEEFRQLLSGQDIPAETASREAPGAKGPRLLRVSTGEEILIRTPEMRLGKSARDNDYVVGENPGVSRHHSVIVTREEGIYVVDLNSTNGTYINGIRIPPMVETLLTHDAKLRLCNELFIVCLEG